MGLPHLQHSAEPFWDFSPTLHIDYMDTETKFTSCELYNLPVLTTQNNTTPLPALLAKGKRPFKMQ
jgi:hypothetical protein